MLKKALTQFKKMRNLKLLLLIFFIITRELLFITYYFRIFVELWFILVCLLKASAKYARTLFLAEISCYATNNDKVFSKSVQTFVGKKSSRNVHKCGLFLSKSTCFQMRNEQNKMLSERRSGIYCFSFIQMCGQSFNHSFIPSFNLNY